VTPAPNAQAAVDTYLAALKADDFPGMYARLSRSVRETVTEEAFTTRHRDALNTMSAGSLDYEVLSSLVNPHSAEVAYKITYHTALVGEIEREMVMRLSLEDGVWTVLWDDGLILPELKGGNLLAMDYSVPARDLYDRAGLPMVTQSDLVRVRHQCRRDQLRDGGHLVGQLSRLCGFNAEDIRDVIASSAPGWYLLM
jgi:penicillin-binding protein 2